MWMLKVSYFSAMKLCVGGGGSRVVAPSILHLGTNWGVSGHFHIPFFLPLDKESVVPIQYEAWWPWSEVVCFYYKIQKSNSPARN